MSGWPLVVILALGLSGCASPSRHDDVQASFGGDKEAIRQTIKDHLVPIRHCYESELKTNPKLEGKLLIEWAIGPKGKVTEAKVNRPMHPKVDQCVVEAVKGWTFPEPSTGTNEVRVIYPFVFSNVNTSQK